FLLTSVASLAPELDSYYSARLIAERFQARASAGDPLVIYGLSGNTIPYSLMFYLRRQIPILGEDPQTLQDQPSHTWGVTDAVHGQTLRQINPDLIQQVGQIG